MIYVIINQSHVDGDEIPNVIEFISTSLQEAENKWETYYLHIPNIEDDKYIYSADLVEYKDGYFFYDIGSSFKILKHVDNVGK